jgi:dolichol-phosphate mannosyltransferase
VTSLRTVIIPTLNEEDNIERLIRSIYSKLGSDDVSIIVADDNSSDRTHDIVRKMKQEFPSLHLLVRRNARGISGAVRLAASKAKEGPVVVMDADFSHDPLFLEPLFQCLDKGYEIVIGSRYIPGGTSVGWPGSRIAISKVATLIARILCQLRIKDPMSGYVGCSRKAILVEGIEHSNMKFLLEIIVKNRSTPVKEIPIVFNDRTRGQSKLGSLSILRYLLLVFRMMFHRRKK